MPELPEVKTVVKHLKNHIINETIIDVIINKQKLIKEIDAPSFQNQLKNSIIQEVFNYGKFIVFKFNNNLMMLSHLRMEGRYRIDKNLQSIGKHDHIIFKLSNDKYLIYNDTRQFGTFHLRKDHNWQTTNPLQKLAKEPEKTNVAKLFKALKSKRIAIKAALLDQTLLVGLGNIYVNEVLWAVKINPEKPAAEITKQQLQSILKNATEILNKATELGGTTIKSFVAFDKTAGSFQEFLKVHQKAGQNCFNCQAQIAKKFVNQRGTYYCPQCQA